jgi:hypothetical protein
MDGSNPQRRSGSRRGADPLEQRLDRWVSAGRQLVDGVAGARPGSRPGGRGANRRAAGLPRPGGLGRWVEDRLDWLLEDDDDWREPWQGEPASRRRESFPLRTDAGSERSWPPASGIPAESAAPATPARQGGSENRAGRPGSRRSLEAISRRGPERLPPAGAGPMPPPAEPAAATEGWPDDSSFQLSRWQRPRRSTPDPLDPFTPPLTPSSGGRPAGGAADRPLPRSSRRRP